jgi:hypothetical protein
VPALECPGLRGCTADPEAHRVWGLLLQALAAGTLTLGALLLWALTSVAPELGGYCNPPPLAATVGGGSRQHLLVS